MTKNFENTIKEALLDVDYKFYIGFAISILCLLPIMWFKYIIIRVRKEI